MDLDKDAGVFAGRRLTLNMVRASARSEDRPLSGQTREVILSALTIGRQALGLTCQQHQLLGFLASGTDKADWQVGGVLLFTKTNQIIGDRFSLGRTQVKMHLRALADAGWIVFRDSPNGHRYRWRDQPDGLTSGGYGIDLSPLSQRWEEIQEARRATIASNREGNRLHGQVASLAKRVRSMIVLAREIGISGEKTQVWDTDVSSLFALRGDDRNVSVLRPLAVRLQDLYAMIEQEILASAPVETDPTGAAERPHYTNTKDNNLAKATVGGIGDAERAQEASRVQKAVVSSRSSSALRGFKAPPILLLTLVPTLRDLCASSRPTEAMLVDACMLLTNHLGISLNGWRQAAHVLGRYEAAVAVCIIAVRHARGEVRFSTEGLLRGMVEKHRRGELALDRSLYGFTNALAKTGAVH